MTMTFKTADLCDAFSDAIAVLEPRFSNFGGISRFSGRAVTLKVFEDNSLVRAALEEPGEGRVLVVDGGSSYRCALLGDQLAQLAVANGWSGIVIDGCIRDSADIAELALGVQAIGTHPLKSVKRNAGQREIAIQMGGVQVRPGDWIYADDDGVIVSSKPL